MGQALKNAMYASEITKMLSEMTRRGLKWRKESGKDSYSVVVYAYTFNISALRESPTNRGKFMFSISTGSDYTGISHHMDWNDCGFEQLFRLVESKAFQENIIANAHTALVGVFKRVYGTADLAQLGIHLADSKD